MTQQIEPANLDRKTLVTVLNYLKDRQLTETEHALKRELGLESLSNVDRHSLSLPTVGQSDSDPVRCQESYSSLLEFVERSLDTYRSELSLLLYPVFVHLYLNLVRGGHVSEAQSFYGRYHRKQESFYEEELVRLYSITTPEHMRNNEIVELFGNSKFTVRISLDCFKSLEKHLQINHQTLISGIISQRLNLDVYDGTPRPMLDLRATIGAMEGEASIKANKSKVSWGIPGDPDILAALQEMEDEENDVNNDDEKPKKKKLKKDYLGSVGKKGKAAVPNAPPLNRIPLPKLRDCEQLAKFTAFKQSAKCLPLSRQNLPSVCFYTLLNTYQELTAVSISEDSTLLAASFSNCKIKLWSLTPKKLCSLKTPAQMQQISLAAEDILERIVDSSSGTELRQLVGHSGPVFCTAFNPDNSFLLSGSEDGTVRLWSLHMYSCLVCFSGHNYPVWSVSFSPHGFYFVTCSHDRTARVWNTDHVQPLRILAGHQSDIDVCKFHPNGNYIATGSSDKTVRLWDILNGHCVRIFTGHKSAIFALAFSPDGKYLASAGSDKQILVWDVGKATRKCGLRGHRDTIHQLAFSKDGTLLVSGGLDNCVKIWDAATFEQMDNQVEHRESLIATYPTKDTPVHCLHFTHKNLLLAAGPFDSNTSPP